MYQTLVCHLREILGNDEVPEGAAFLVQVTLLCGDRVRGDLYGVLDDGLLIKDERGLYTCIPLSGLSAISFDRLGGAFDNVDRRRPVLVTA